MKCREVFEYFAQTDKSCELLLRKWCVLEDMKNVLHIPYLTTVILQKNDFTLSDFYGCLQIIELKLKQIIQSPKCKRKQLAQSLQRCIHDRKPKLVETPLMICALFLDPRYKYAIDSDHEKVQLAKLTLEHIWDRFLSSSLSNETEQETSIVDATPDDNMAKYYEELDLHLNESLGLESIGHCSSSSTTRSHGKRSIIDAISRYEKSVLGLRMKSSESIHSFWETKREEFGSELYEIACIVFAIPPTQASVERDFSALKYMFTDKRYNLRPDLLESLLMIHLNRIFFAQVQTTAIENMQKENRFDKNAGAKKTTH